MVIADKLFTTLAIVVQLATGLWFTHHFAISFSSAWFIAVMGLFMFIGACWLPVVWIQIRIRELAARGAARGDYRKLMQTWTILGAVALAAILVLFFLMASRLGAYS